MEKPGTIFFGGHFHLGCIISAMELFVEVYTGQFEKIPLVCRLLILEKKNRYLLNMKEEK